MGAGGGFGVVLEGEGAEGGRSQAFDAMVVEGAVGDGGEVWVQRFFHYHEVVVLGGDLDAAVEEVFDGMVATVVAEGKAGGFGAEGEGEQLVAEADAHDG